MRTQNSLREMNESGDYFRKMYFQDVTGDPPGDDTSDPPPSDPDPPQEPEPPGKA